MKKRAKILAGILAGCMIFGQTVFAEEAVSEDQTPAETAEAVSEETKEQAQAEEEKTPAAESANAADAQSVEVEKTIYAGIPVRMEQICDEVPWYYTAQSSDPSICEVSAVRERQDNSGNGYSRFNLIGKKPGSVDITFTDEYDYSVKFVYHVEVKAAPEDAVPFRDAALNGKLLADGRYDKNSDGYISVSEMKEQDYFDLSPYSGAYYEEEFITDLSGMEYAENAATVYLAGNETLENIDALAGLKKLSNISLDNTAVSDAAKWEFADFTDMTCEKGYKVQIPSVSGLFGYDYSAVKAEILDNPEDNVISEIQGGNYEYPYFHAFTPGTAKLRVTWGTFTTDITVTVTGIDADQPMDTAYGVSVQFGTAMGEDGNYDTYALKENGELWRITPELEVIGQNVKKVADPYVLTEDGKVYDINDMKTAVIEGVKDLSTDSALKEDGTAWEASEDGTWSKAADDVKQIYGKQFYLKNDGNLYRWSDDSLFRENVEYVVQDGYYVTGEGFYQYATASMMGDVRAVDAAYTYHNEIDGKYTTYDLLVTEEGEVWASLGGAYYAGSTGEVVKLGSDFAGFCSVGDQWDWRDTKGNYYKWDQIVTPSKTSPLQLAGGSGSLFDYALMSEGDDSDNHLYKNGAELLNGVKDIVEVYGGNTVIALRNDGSIWDVTGTPKKLGTLNTGDDIVRGDVTGDGLVKIDDLRLVLRSVCKKVTLTPAQKQAADVEQNGEVDIADLRLILRFVCGKVESL